MHIVICVDWDNHPIPHLNGTIPGGSKRKDANGGGGGKKRKKGPAMAGTPAVLSTDEHQARQSRAKRFEAHLQASSSVSSNNVRGYPFLTLLHACPTEMWHYIECAAKMNNQKRAGGWMPPATMLHRNLNEFEDLDDMERVRGT